MKKVHWFLFLLLTLGMVMSTTGASAARPQLSNDSLYMQALSKLTADEAAALLSTYAAVAQGYSSSSNGQHKHSLDEALRLARELHASLWKPAKWLGPCGQEYDTHGEYIDDVFLDGDNDPCD